MNLQLKENQIFIHPLNGAKFNEVIGVLKNLNLSSDDETLNYKIKFYVSKEAVRLNKAPVFEKTFSINNVNKYGKFDEAEEDLTLFMESDSFGFTNRQVIYYGIFKDLISRPGFDIFEINPPKPTKSSKKKINSKNTRKEPAKSEVLMKVDPRKQVSVKTSSKSAWVKILDFFKSIFKKV